MNKENRTDCEIFETALYLRLSRDDTRETANPDGSRKSESNSISNQRELLRSFVKDHDDLRIFDIYIDDGYSGTTFDRPEFNRMITDVNDGKVKCILTKDLSRFGRDYITVGKYLQKIFPSLGIRFIAVTDNYDSLTADMTDSSLILPVKNFVNDSYCRDISMKVKAQQKVKRQEGKCISAFPVYGYLKNSNDKNQLIPDDYAAGIVRSIFSWKLEGMSLAVIASKLNGLHILSPMEYKKSLGMKYNTGFEGPSKASWSAMAVKRILTNSVYIGNMVQGRQEKINYKLDKRIQKPENEWISVEHTHEALVSEMDFKAVQRLLKYDGRKSEGSETSNIFTGILICADCKTPMIKRVNTYKGKKKVFYICQTKNKSLGCSRHSIEEEQLMRITLSEIKAYLMLMIEYDEIIKMLQGLEVNYEQVVEHDFQISRLQTEYNKFFTLKTSLYDDLKDGLINKEEFEEFHSMYTAKCEEAELAIATQKQMIQEMFKNGVSSGIQLEELKKSLEITVLERKLLVMFIERIYVHENKKLEFEFCFQNIHGTSACALEKLNSIKQFCNESIEMEVV